MGKKKRGSGEKGEVKKTKKKIKIVLPPIIVDTREKSPHTYKKAKDNNGFKIQKLDVGDYSLEGFEDYVVVERKNGVDELVNCFGTERKRFMRELDSLSDVPFKYIVVEEGLSRVFGKRRFSRMAPKCFLSNVFSIIVKRGIPVFFCKNRSEAHATIFWLLYKAYSFYLEEQAEIERDKE